MSTAPTDNNPSYKIPEAELSDANRNGRISYRGQQLWWPARRAHSRSANASYAGRRPAPNHIDCSGKRLRKYRGHWDQGEKSLYDSAPAAQQNDAATLHLFQRSSGAHLLIEKMEY